MIDYTGFKFAKDPKHAAKVERAENSHARAVKEASAKRESKKLDGGRCRWPHVTPEEKRQCRAEAKHSAHYKAKGMGGDHGTRSKPEDTITVCFSVHEGPRSLHSGHRRVVPLTPKKMRGPVAFEEKQGGKWVRVGEEISVGVLA